MKSLAVGGALGHWQATMKRQEDEIVSLKGTVRRCRPNMSVCM